jgi:hypothetical protein
MTLEVRASNLFSACSLVYVVHAWHGSAIASACVRYEGGVHFRVLITLQGPRSDAVRRHILRRLISGLNDRPPESR